MDQLNYNSDGSDPLKLAGIINSLRRELREERHKKFLMISHNQRLEHKVKRLEHALKNEKKSFQENSRKDVRKRSNSDKTNSESEDDENDDDERLIRRLQSRSRHLFSALKKCQAQRDDLQIQSDGQERIKEWMDTQLEHLEVHNNKLEQALLKATKERDDAIVQMNADSDMKDFLAQQWEEARINMNLLKKQCQELIDQKRDLMIQIKADATMKEYLAGQLDVLEEKQKHYSNHHERSRVRGRY